MTYVSIASAVTLVYLSEVVSNFGVVNFFDYIKVMWSEEV